MVPKTDFPSLLMGNGGVGWGLQGQDCKKKRCNQDVCKEKINYKRKNHSKGYACEYLEEKVMSCLYFVRTVYLKLQTYQVLRYIQFNVAINLSCTSDLDNPFSYSFVMAFFQFLIQFLHRVSPPHTFVEYVNETPQIPWVTREGNASLHYMHPPLSKSLDPRTNLTIQDRKFFSGVQRYVFLNGLCGFSEVEIEQLYRNILFKNCEHFDLNPMLLFLLWQATASKKGDSPFCDSKVKTEGGNSLLNHR